MMPSIAPVGIPGPRWLPPLPLPLFLLWPFVFLCSGLERLLDRQRPDKAAKLRAAVQVFHDLRGLSIDVEPTDGKPVRIRFI